MSSNVTSIRLVRKIVRKLRTNVALLGEGRSADSSIKTTRQFIFAKTRNSVSESSSKSDSLLKLGENYAKLLEDLKERERLLRLDTGVENKLSPKEMSRRAAARSGLLLPDVNSGST
jgi:hypothetical protein